MTLYLFIGAAVTKSIINQVPGKQQKLKAADAGGWKAEVKLASEPVSSRWEDCLPGLTSQILASLPSVTSGLMIPTNELRGMQAFRP